MTRRIAHRLTVYRRHAAKCPIKADPRKLDACQCPLWAHGSVRGKRGRWNLDTRSVATAFLRKDDLLGGRGGGDAPPPGGPIAVMKKAPKAEEITLEYAEAEFNEAKSKARSKKGRVVSVSTRINYARAVNHFVRWAHANGWTLLRQIDTPAIEVYLSANDSEWTGNTAQARLVHLRIFFNWCARKRHWITIIPTDDRDLNYAKATKTAVRLPFAPEDITRILAAIDEIPESKRDRARAVILLMLFTGMRISDATFFERGYITKGNSADYWIIKSRKQIELAPELQQVVLDALAKLPPSTVYFFQPDRADNYDEARTTLRDGGDFRAVMPEYLPRVEQLTRLVKQVLARAGVEGACHRFRETFAINMLVGDGEKNADIYTVSKMLGHADVQMTDRHYMKLVPGYRERMSRLTRVLSYQFPVAS